MPMFVNKHVVLDRPPEGGATINWLREQQSKHGAPVDAIVDYDDCGDWILWWKYQLTPEEEYAHWIARAEELRRIEEQEAPDRGLGF